MHARADRPGPDDLLTDEEIALLTPDELAAYGAYLQREIERHDSGVADLEVEPVPWLRAMFPGYCLAPFAAHHEDLWAWVWDLQAGVRPPVAKVCVWPRGGAKSTSAELAVAAVGARRTRRYVLYVCDTQDQADDHVANIAGLLESDTVAQRYPALGRRRVGKYGNSRGWRRNRLVTDDGLVVDAIGLDTAARGIKFDQDRPDLLVLDDIDVEGDTPATTATKVERITKKLLPAGATSLAVLAIQNLVTADGVFAQLVDGRADFLANRSVSGPVPAVEGLVVEPALQPDGSTRWTIVAGTPMWEGQDLATCQAQIDDWGISSFRAEAQHEVSAPPGGMFDHLAFQHCERAQVPSMVRTTVWVDPAVTDTDSSDSHAVQCDGLGVDGVLYRLASWEGRTSPEDSLRRAIRFALHHGSRTVGVETDQGGDTWRSVYREACRAVSVEDDVSLSAMPTFTSDKAGAGHGPKVHRAAQMLADYERPGRIVHVLDGHPEVEAEQGCAQLERALRRFPKSKPFDLTDAAYWSWVDLREVGPTKSGVREVARARLPDTKASSLVGARRTSPGGFGRGARFR